MILFSLPPCGGGPGWGSLRESRTPQHCDHRAAWTRGGIPTPDPSPQGGGEQNHFGGSKPFARQRSAIACEVSAVMKERAAGASVLLAGIAAV